MKTLLLTCKQELFVWCLQRDMANGTVTFKIGVLIKYWRWSLKWKVNKIIVGIAQNETKKGKKKIFLKYWQIKLIRYCLDKMGCLHGLTPLRVN